MSPVYAGDHLGERFVSTFTPHARLLRAADLVRTALLDLRGSTAQTATHAIMDARDLEAAERHLECAVAYIVEATADLHGAENARYEVTAAGREQLAALDASLEVTAP